VLVLDAMRMALATRHKTPTQIKIAEVIGDSLHAVRPDDDLAKALDLMASARVRRLPVVSGRGEAVGVLSLNDVILKTEMTAALARSSPLAHGALRTLKAVCEHRLETVTTGSD
jgi:CBS domain-containing protein